MTTIWVDAHLSPARLLERQLLIAQQKYPHPATLKRMN